MQLLPTIGSIDGTTIMMDIGTDMNFTPHRENGRDIIAAIRWGDGDQALLGTTEITTVTGIEEKPGAITTGNAEQRRLLDSKLFHRLNHCSSLQSHVSQQCASKLV